MSGALNFTLADVTKFVLHTYIHYRECQLDNTDYWITVFSKVISFMLEKRGSANLGVFFRLETQKENLSLQNHFSATLKITSKSAD